MASTDEEMKPSVENPNKNGGDEEGGQNDRLDPPRQAQTEESSSLSSSELPAPPDGGWGWVVVFASFMIHVVADGITYTFGIYLVELMDAFPSSGRGSVSLIPSILVGVTLCAGPAASSLTNRYGCRPVTVLGALLASAGLALSSLAPNLSVLYLTAGVTTGLGFGFIYLPAIVSVSMYFEKRRAFATGIAVCGSGLGTFIMAPVTRGLIDWLGWRGALAATGAIVLTCVGFGALFRPLRKESDESDNSDSEYDEEDRKGLLMDGDVGGSNGSALKLPPLVEVTTNGGLTIAPPEIQLNGEPLRPLATQFFEQQQQRQQQQQNGRFPRVSQGGGKMSDLARCALSHPVLSNNATGSTDQDIQFGSYSRIYEKKKAKHHHHHQRRNSHHHHHHHHHHPDAGVMFRKDILYGGSLYNIPEYKHDPKGYSRQVAKEQLQQKHETEHLSSSDEDEDEEDKTDVGDAGAGGDKKKSEDAEKAASAVAVKDAKKRKNSLCPCLPGRRHHLLSSEQRATLLQMLDVSLLKDAVFLAFAASNFLTSVGFNVPYVYTVDRAEQELGVDKDSASFLLAVIGISNTLGRIALGYLSDKPWVNRLYLYNVCLAICGLTIGLSTFWPSYAGQSSYCALFGVTSGAYVGLTSVVLVDLLGLDRLTNAFGLLMLFQGIASVIGPPIIGAIYDAVGDYAAGFYFAGAMIFISGVMLFALPAIIRRRERMEAENKNKRNGGAVANA